MLLETSRFGTVDVSAESVVTFVQPIIGFQEYRRFVVLPGPEGGFVKWLQAVDSPDLAFLIMDPRTVVPDYEVKVSEPELAELAANSIETLEIYTLVVVPRDRAQVRTNLRAPILINPGPRLARQAILENTEYPVQYFLTRPQRASQAPQEVQ